MGRPILAHVLFGLFVWSPSGLADESQTEPTQASAPVASEDSDAFFEFLGGQESDEESWKSVTELLSGADAASEVKSDE